MVAKYIANQLNYIKLLLESVKGARYEANTKIRRDKRKKVAISCICIW